MNPFNKSLYLDKDADFNSLDYLGIVNSRIKKLKMIQSDARLLHACKVFYAKNPISFIEDWICTYDSRARDFKTMPFILFKRQRHFINWLVERLDKEEDGIVEKSREVGVTHLAIAFMIWMFLFKDEVSVGISSLKERRVDTLGDPNSFLEKGRQMLRLIPSVFLPYGFDVEKHCLSMRFINPVTGSSIIGEAGKNIGRGSRCTMYFKDESDFYDHPELIEASLSQTSRCKIDMSTINNPGGVFYRKRHSGHYPVFVFDWTHDPRKNEDWYNEQVKKYGSVIVGREIDRNWDVSNDNICIPSSWVMSAVHKGIKAHNISLQEPIIAGLDVADGGGANNVLIIRKGPYVLSIHSWSDGGVLETGAKALKICREQKVEYLNYDGHGIGAGLSTEFERLITSWDCNSIRITNTLVGSAPPKRNDLGTRFRNLKAFLWFTVRRRFEAAHEYKKGIAHKNDKSKFIFIPEHHELIKQLSTPSYYISDNGCITIEKKSDLLKRGHKSPDFADAFMLAYHVPSSPVTFSVI